MDIGSILLGLALLAVIAFVVARPLLEHISVPDTPASPSEQLLGQREQVLTQLRDLDFDHAMSKINEADYAAQRAQLVVQGVALLKQLDALGAAGEAAGSDGSADETIEAAVARRRGRNGASAATGEILAEQIEARVAERRAGKPVPAAASMDAQIEASVVERRASLPAAADKPALAERVFCGQCGTQAQPGDRFCARCGAALPAPDARVAKVQS